MRIWTRTVTVFLLVSVIAAACGVEGRSDKHAAAVCDSVVPLLTARRSLDALERKTQNANRVVTSPSGFRRLSLTYRHEEAALDHHEVVQRANARYFKMESALNSGLTSLGFEQRRGVFVIDC